MKSKGKDMSKSSFQIRPVAGLEAQNRYYDAQVFVFPLKVGAKKWSELVPSHFDREGAEFMGELAQRLELRVEAGKALSFDRHPRQRWSVGIVADEQETFQLLGMARSLVKPLKDFACRSILVDLSALSPARALALIDAITAAVQALQFKAPRYEKPGKTPARDKGKDAQKPWAPEVDFAINAELDQEAATQAAQAAEFSAAANNRVRFFVMQAGNDLTPKRYQKMIKDAATEEGLGFEFYSQKKLATMEAGAFLAVAQGAAHEDAGIIKLTYEPKRKSRGREKAGAAEPAEKLPHLCLVGKGVTFDTGGTNLKPAQYMWGMHRDMAGSAVAYALISLAAREEWPFRVTAYLALVENATGPHAYRQNDVITALSGKTIEVVHTDAEGRMILADTLHLAAEEKPDLIVDFATLTGACVAAISTVYAGAFTNRPAYHSSIIAAGKSSGERVWPFPMDADFGECLKSDIADIKQCRLTGGVDHIEAAIFLSEFVPKDIPWVHVDLSAAENSGGLAHIDTEVTGFGVRFGAHLIKDLLLKAPQP